VLRSVEIAAVLTGPIHDAEFHNLHWQGKVEFSLDCFICERTGRTTRLERGAERAICSADEGHGQHFTAARIAAFDDTAEQQQLALRAIMDFWWAPFHDAKRDQAARGLPSASWVRLHLGYYCPQRRESGQLSIQSNMMRPVGLACGHCDRVIATSSEAPRIQWLS
jgi:hypothetical protein